MFPCGGASCDEMQVPPRFSFIRRNQILEHAFGLDIPPNLEEVCNPQRIALLVYVMQVGILSQIKNGDKITTRVVQVLQAAREASVRVFFCRHMSLPKELMGLFQLLIAMAWQAV